ncbi:MAG: hypothetical protein ACRD21_29000, partial [Vicinamibacteria bacterium]
MRIFFTIVAASCAALSFGQERIRGFTSDGTRRQLEIEGRYQAIPESAALREWHRYFTSEPHP